MDWDRVIREVQGMEEDAFKDLPVYAHDKELWAEANGKWRGILLVKSKLLALRMEEERDAKCEVIEP